MKNNNQAILFGIGGLILGMFLSTYIASNAINTNNTQMMRMMGVDTRSMTQYMSSEGTNEMMGHGNEMGMDEMVDVLKELQGDEFDKSFINLMIDHHQGAIDMANEALINANHDEIKNLAKDIITAQNNEIKVMKQWIIDWRY
ncbi:MAG: DUF305 domain-containing protein [Patescibacteria group bacterium]